MIRIVVADDSPTARRLLVEILESDPELRVVGQAATGVEAVGQVEALQPDLVIMDVFMPELDGLEATKRIMVRSPRPIIIVSTATSVEGVALSLSATEAGAVLALPKPEGPGSPDFDAQRNELVAMARAMAEVRVVRRWERANRATAHAPAHRRPLRRRRPRPGVPRAVAMAASTGGPAAVQRVLSTLPPDFPVPIFLVQHIATGFVDGLVTWLGRGCDLQVRMAGGGEPALGGTVYVAPDGRHMGAAGGRVVLADDPPIDGFRPSATFLFDSVSRAYDGAVAAVLLTGMGSDGVAGLEALRARGGIILAQDRDSSVVFGMAAEALEAGLVDDVLPLGDIGPRLRELAAGGDDPR